MKMPTRRRTETMTKPSAAMEEPAPHPFGQGKPPEVGQFRLQVDRQTKASFVTYKAAEEAGLAIKQGHPILQVAVYDTVNGINKIIEQQST